MEFTKFNAIYSPERLKKYYRASRHDARKTQMLYYYNHRLARAFQPLISNIEVVLRNKLNKAISVTYSDNKWLLHRVAGYTPTGHTERLAE